MRTAVVKQTFKVRGPLQLLFEIFVSSFYEAVVLIGNKHWVEAMCIFRKQTDAPVDEW